MYYVPNILIRRSRAGDVFTVTVTPVDSWFFGFVAIAGSITVDWGDGSAPETKNPSVYTRYTHTYADAGTYTASFYGTNVTRLMFGIPEVTVKSPLTGCNFNWSALPGLTKIEHLFYGYNYLNSTLSSLPASVTAMASSFQNCSQMYIGAGLLLPPNVASIAYAFYNNTLGGVDINTLGSSFPYLKNINEAFRNSDFSGDATAFKNKCAANVTYTDAFTGSRCTNIPA